MSKYQVNILPAGIQFISGKDGKEVELEKFVPVMDEQESVVVLAKEAQGRGKVTEASLSALVKILQSPTLDSYKGKQSPGERVSPEMKEELRRLEVEYFRDLFLGTLPKKMDADKRQEAWAEFNKKALREPGVYQTVRQTCIKFFAYIGRLPCVYDDKNQPLKDKLLSVSAMNKLIENMDRPAGSGETAIAQRLGELQDKMVKGKENLKNDAIKAIQGRLEQFLQECREILNARSQAATAAHEGKATAEQMSMLSAAGVGMPAPVPTEVVGEPASRAQDASSDLQLAPIDQEPAPTDVAAPKGRRLTKKEHTATASV